MRRKAAIYLILFFLLLLSACSVSFPSDHQPGELLMVDDFSSPNLEWDVWKRADGSTVGYYQEGLVFIINSPNTDYISAANSLYTNTRTEVIASNLNGLMNNGFGLICRYQDESNYYAFFVSSDGYYGIVRVLYGGYTVLNGGELQYSEYIHQGQSTNHIRADCNSNQLALFVNNIQLAQVQDDVFSEGKIGLITSSFEEPGVAILFDDFLAIYP
jgi:hypothetical protein